MQSLVKRFFKLLIPYNDLHIEGRSHEVYKLLMERFPSIWKSSNNRLKTLSSRRAKIIPYVLTCKS